jgi:hypothetical protein
MKIFKLYNRWTLFRVRVWHNKIHNWWLFVHTTNRSHLYLLPTIDISGKSITFFWLTHAVDFSVIKWNNSQE